MQKIYKNALPVWLCASFLFAVTSLHAQLKADFTISSIIACTQLADTFTDKTSGGQTPYSYHWNFGNTKSSTTQNSTTIYSTSGTFNVTLKVTDANNNVDSVTKSIKVLGSPKADYSFTRQGCGPAYYQANEDSLSPTSITKYMWIGEGTPGYGPLYMTGNSGKYTYYNGGTYHYDLVVTGANGCTATYQDSIKIPTFPGISLPGDTNVCANTSLSITATPSGGTPPYTIWWGDVSANITGPTIKPTIMNDTAFGVYIRDSNGCLNYDSTYVNAYPLPNSHWTLNHKLDSVELRSNEFGFKDSSYVWFFLTDNNQRVTKSFGPVVKRIFSSDSTYDIGLVITDTHGCTSQFDSTINGAKLGLLRNQVPDFETNIYPNPFNSFTTLQYTLSGKSNVQIGLYDITGRQVVIIRNETEVQGVHQMEINTEKYHLTQGIYLLKLITNQGYISRQIVKL